MRPSSATAVAAALLGAFGMACGDSEAAGDVVLAPDRGDETREDVTADLPSDQPGPSFAPLTAVATQNTGTTPFLDLYMQSPLREVCEQWYSNNLCAVVSEHQLAAHIDAERPGIVMLQEVWDSALCADPQRPAEVNEAPYVCSLGDAPQPQRLLPDGYRFACAHGYRDNCIGFDANVFTPTPPDDGAACVDGDCSAMMVDIAADCGPPGRAAWLRGETELGPTVLVVVHTNAGVGADDQQCRAEQLAKLGETLASEAADAALFIAGDFNFDPEGPAGADVDALAQLMQELGLQRLPDDADTHRFLGDLDLFLVRGWPAAASASCQVTFVDAEDEVWMFDHGFLSCR